MRRLKKRYWLPAAFSIVMTSCDLAIDPDDGWKQILGIIDPETDGYVSVPDTVSAGTSFDVTFRTIGSGCVRGGGTIVVAQSANSAVVEPQDFVPDPPPDACNDILNTFPHRATLRFDQPGSASVRVRGLLNWPFNRPDTVKLDTVTIERIVVVR